jgi:hypothetical protein
MNIAQRIIQSYSSEDFISQYSSFLGEDTHNCIDNIQRILSTHYDIDIGHYDAEKILIWFYTNGETRLFNGFYVGDECIDSVSFGEQEVQLDFMNYNTKKPYNQKYLRKVFDEEGYEISGDLAYYNLSGGVMYDFRDFTPAHGEDARFSKYLLTQWLKT